MPPIETPEEDPVFAGLREAIIRQRLPPGTRLHEVALAGIFDVSRTRIRAALQRLQHMGLVSSGRKQIARVSQPSVKEARELFTVRRLIEPAVAAQVAALATPAARRTLQGLIRDEHAARERGDRLEAVRLAGEFHVALADMAGNGVVSRLIRELIDRAALVIFMYQIPSAAPCVHEEHSSLVEAIERGDETGAAETMLRHIHGIESRMALEEKADVAVDLKAAFAGILKAAH